MASGFMLRMHKIFHPAAPVKKSIDNGIGSNNEQFPLNGPHPFSKESLEVQDDTLPAL